VFYSATFGVGEAGLDLADSNFFFIALSNGVVSGAVWGGLSSAMLLTTVACATVNIHVQAKTIVALIGRGRAINCVQSSNDAASCN
jgi:hypothetical protein